MAGKGSRPRNCFSKKFKDNFEQIRWATTEGKEIRNYEKKKGKKIYRYP